jgi:hypothetical protein
MLNFELFNINAKLLRFPTKKKKNIIGHFRISGILKFINRLIIHSDI